MVELLECGLTVNFSVTIYICTVFESILVLHSFVLPARMCFWDGNTGSLPWQHKGSATSEKM